MSAERLGLHSDPNEKDIRRVDSIVRLAGKVACAPNPGDPIEPVLLRALKPQLSGSPGSIMGGGDLRAPVAHAFSLTSKEVFPDGIALRKIEGAIDKQARALEPDDYPLRGHEPDFYEQTDLMERIDGEELFEDIYKPLRYNDPDAAYKVTSALINRLAPQRWQNHKPTVVDVGRAFGVGTKKMKMYPKWPYQPTRALLPPTRGFQVSPHLPLDQETQSVIETALDQEPAAGRIVGVDLWPPTAADLELGSSETFLMSQRLRRPTAVEQFHAIYEEDGTPYDVWLPQIHTDATHTQDLERLQETDLLPDGKADIFIFSGVVLQFPQDDLEKIFKNFQAIANPGAIAVVNEWAYIKEGRLKTYKGAHWQNNGGFKTFILDIWNSARSPLEVCRYTNRQCENIVFTPQGCQVMDTGRLPSDEY